MKSILISIKPQWVAKILNGEKTIEIRKKFPKDYVGWVYIYNTKDIKDGYLTNTYIGNKLDFITSYSHHPKYRGKVVARFWCDKVGKIHCNSYGLETSEHWYRTQEMNGKELLEKSCLTFEELDQYLCWNNAYAIHITNLEIFDKPKEIGEFGRYYLCEYALTPFMNKEFVPLTRAPQSWCYVEVL